MEAEATGVCSLYSQNSSKGNTPQQQTFILCLGLGQRSSKVTVICVVRQQPTKPSEPLQNWRIRSWHAHYLELTGLASHIGHRSRQTNAKRNSNMMHGTRDFCLEQRARDGTASEVLGNRSTKLSKRYCRNSSGEQGRVHACTTRSTILRQKYSTRVRTPATRLYTRLVLQETYQQDAFQLALATPNEASSSSDRVDLTQ
jgi:hypothetical protein